jgi:hypothetical protein
MACGLKLREVLYIRTMIVNYDSKIFPILMALLNNVVANFISCSAFFWAIFLQRVDALVNSNIVIY